MEILIILLMLVALGVVALRWGCNSTEQVDSAEWEKRAGSPFIAKKEQNG